MTARYALRSQSGKRDDKMTVPDRHADLRHVRRQSRLVLLAHRAGFKRARENITELDLWLAKLHAPTTANPTLPRSRGRHDGDDDDDGLAEVGEGRGQREDDDDDDEYEDGDDNKNRDEDLSLPANWIRGKNDPLARFLEAWRRDAFAVLGWRGKMYFWGRVWTLDRNRREGMGIGIDGVRMYVGNRWGVVLEIPYRLFVAIDFRLVVLVVVVVMAVSASVCYHNYPRLDEGAAGKQATLSVAEMNRTPGEGPTAGSSPSPGQMVIVSTPETPKINAETALACLLTREYASLERRKPEDVSLYELGRLPALLESSSLSWPLPSSSSCYLGRTAVEDGNGRRRDNESKGEKETEKGRAKNRKTVSRARTQIMSAREIPYDVIVHAFAAAVTRTWRAVEMACSSSSPPSRLDE